ncbi:hypothetical protein NVIE_024840 [Nitrososphaera viennensis EN76]|uniref:Uncharacterized protein n=1 Tax=Nitrososphaera viennensis EN76 TaxID=926571 RepID=A0A060HJL9_9ARCH|nr:hypothetical protein NVIE_024840 [Nitrososphaera viennensis EN76]
MDVLKIIGKVSPIILLLGLVLFEVLVLYEHRADNLLPIIFLTSFVMIMVGIIGTLWTYVMYPRLFSRTG